MSTKVLNQETGAYLTDEEVISMAVAIINHRFGLKRASLNSPALVRDYLKLTLTDKTREVVKMALHHNCAALILAHNHPSGVAEPSHADQCLTAQLKQTLALVDVKVLDHFIIAADQTLSMAERGLL